GILTAEGTLLPTRIDSVCVHGDSAHAVGLAQAVRARLETAGIALRGLGQDPRGLGQNPRGSVRTR
uniref:LamB/YcsF family protein n=1 Tax=Escherichia ruysiae TaxID=2608867 RepID=UPI00215A5F30